MPEPNTEGRTLGDFYDIHYGQAHRNTYFGRGPKTLKARELKGVQQIFLELVIDVKGVRAIFLTCSVIFLLIVSKFAERTRCAPPSQVQGTSKGRPPKRRDRSTSPSSTGTQFKKPRRKLSNSSPDCRFTVMFTPYTAVGGTRLPTSVVPRLAVSSSMGPGATLSTKPCEHVELVIASTTVNPDDYTLAVSWDLDDGAKLYNAEFSQTVSWSGKTKHVYAVCNYLQSVSYSLTYKYTLFLGQH